MSTETSRAELKSKLSKLGIDPQVLQAILLDEVTGRLADIAELLSQRGPFIPEGIVQPYEFTVNVLEANKFELKFDNPVFSMVIKNDGPNSVFRSVNVINKSLEIESRDESVVNMSAPLIRRVYFWVAAAGQSADLRIDTVR